MRRIMLLSAILLMSLTGCDNTENRHYWQPDNSHIMPFLDTDEPMDEQPETIHAVWIPVMQYADWMTGKSENDFKTAVSEAFENCRKLGINTVFVHVRAYGDAYYESTLFPKGAYLTGDYDPLAVMTEEAHAKGLSIHAWINPLRCQTPEHLASTDKRYVLRQWYADDEMNGTRMVCVDGRYWLDPAYPEVRQLVADGVTEILDAYDVDGIHIDDYFYPTQDAEFDEKAFAESGASDLAAFRRENCSQMVSLLYDTVKSHDPECIFSISPQGNIRSDLESQYADVKTWSREAGYCDWIVPQLYYGFQNDTCPFSETLAEWQELADSAKLVIGLAAYKVGAEDPWAGDGAWEWIADTQVLSTETAMVLDENALAGVAFYSYASVFTPEPDAAPIMQTERERIQDMLLSDEDS